jgi:hypothetical protein
MINRLGGTTMRRVVGAGASVVALGIIGAASVALATPASAAGVHDADIALTPTGGFTVDSDGTWEAVSGGTFAIGVTNSGSSDESGVEIAVRIPTGWDVQVSSDGWNCWDLDSNGDVACATTIPETSGAEWPELQATLTFPFNAPQGTVAVGARVGQNGVPDPGEDELDQTVVPNPGT